MAKLKVYGGWTFNAGQQVRTIVATTSQKKAAELVGCSLGEIQTYWATTTNEREVAAAMAQPGTVLRASSLMAYDFVAQNQPKPK